MYVAVWRNIAPYLHQRNRVSCVTRVAYVMYSRGHDAPTHACVAYGWPRAAAEG